MQKHYHKRWREARDFTTAALRLEKAAHWFESYHLNSDVQARKKRKWLEYLAVLNVYQFRCDLLNLLRKDIKPEYLEAAQRGEIALSYEMLQSALKAEPHPVRGNRMRFKSVEPLVDFLFDFDDKLERRSWAKMSYRYLLQKTILLLQEKVGQSTAELWYNDFKRLIPLTHWLLPYASKESFFQSTKANKLQRLQSEKMWLSVIIDGCGKELYQVEDAHGQRNKGYSVQGMTALLLRDPNGE